MTRNHWLVALLGLLATSACGDDTTMSDDGDDTGTTGMQMTTTTIDPSTGTTDPSTTTTTTMTTMTTEVDSSTTEVGPPPEPADFLLRIENISGTSVMPTAFSPGVWMEQGQDAGPPFYQPMMAPLNNGIRALAEDGDPTELAANLSTNFDLLQSGVFDTPVDGSAGPLAPGEVYEVEFTADPFSRLGLATMFASTNDVFVGTAPQGVALFHGNGQPQDFRDISSFLLMLDAGTEANQAPGQGPDQGAFQDAAGQGAPESGAVTAFSSSTRAIPMAGAIVGINVTVEDGTFTIELTNVSQARGTLVTALSPVVWALHDDTFALFEPGSPAPTGLEALAEDGDPTELEGALASASSVDASGVISGEVAPGDSFEIIVTPAASGPLLSFATMVAETNDAFIAPLPSGIALLDAQGQPRTANAVANDLQRKLAVWDAGTEANEVPGVGVNQQPRQADPDTGPDDEDPNVRLYADLTNDLAGENAGGFLSVTVVQGIEPDEFEVTITNTSDATVYPGLLSSVVWAVHDDTVYLFEEGVAASPGLEDLAEDGDPTGLLADLTGSSGVAVAGVVDRPDGGDQGDPLLPGDSFTFTISGVNATERYFSFATMIQPSNDTFAAFGPQGIALWNDDGALSDEDIAASITAALRAWDAGTEANQAGAAGRDQAPQQSSSGAGVPEGPAIVRNASTDPVWSYPDVTSLLRVTIEPVR
jgi:hypothetical protein